jgi:ribosomal protein S6--L-glutamate ligase
MRFAVLAAAESWYFRDLCRAASGRHELTAIPFSRLVSSNADGAFHVMADGQDLATYDAVLVRTMPPGSLEQVVFRMDALARLEAAGQAVLNPPRSLEAAIDKYLASARLAAAGVPTPRTCVCQGADDAMEAFVQLGGDVVVKPIFGGEGRGLMRVGDESLALRVFKTLAQCQAAIYLQEFIPHEGFDERVLLIGDRALAMRRRHPHDWRTNISRGATAEPLAADDELVSLARRAAEAVGTTLSGVDILTGREGRRYVIEVNGVPGWKGLASALNVDVAALVLDELAKAAARKGPSLVKAVS